MSTQTAPATDVPVRKTITVKARVERAFQVFTNELDSWWPRSHHIGKTPMKRTLVEARAGGRCYSEHEGGAECDWGRVLVWEPPRRLVMAWRISPAWQFEPDLAKASEVEVRFTPEPDGSTRVDLEHRHFRRHGVGPEVDAMRATVDSPNGWGGLLDLFAARAAAAGSSEAAQ
jgi:uncharacterized protein YndB with AHSA1/START domain